MISKSWSQTLGSYVNQASTEVMDLVAQSSATVVTVAATPCSAIRFRNPRVPRYLHQPAGTPALGPLPAANERKVRQGGLEKGATP